MNRERAETYLRVLAEEELRRATSQPWGNAQRAGYAAPVPLGQIVRVRGADVPGEVYLLSYTRVASGPQFSLFARTRQPSSPWQPAGPRLFDPFTATDEKGTRYQVTIRDIGSPVLGWTLMLHPDPPHDPQWLNLTTTTTGGGPAARIVLPAAAGETRPLREGQQHPAHARKRPGMSHGLRAGRTLFLATDLDMRQQWPLARHPHQRSERHEQRNRATPGNSAIAKPRHDLDRGAGSRAIS